MRNHLNWRNVLTQNRIEFVERGPNVKRGELNIQCPFCGSADPSHHMGLSQETGWWACWRNRDHRGKSPVRLLQRLLGCTYERARELCGFDAEYVDPDEFQSAIARFMGRVKEEPVKAAALLTMPKEFAPIEELPMMVRDRMLDYLHARRFTLRDRDPERLCEDYSLHGAYKGDYAHRIILPYYQGQQLVAWTGRAITSTAQVRYKDIPVVDAAVQVRHTFYNYNALLDPQTRVLVVCEGPFDALKLDFYLREHGVRAVAISTNSLSHVQESVLREHAPRFSRVCLMLDQATELGVVDSMRMARSLSDIRHLTIIKSYGEGSEGVKDAGAMSPRMVLAFLDYLIKIGCV
jgi:hypothetical protein